MEPRQSFTQFVWKECFGGKWIGWIWLYVNERKLVQNELRVNNPILFDDFQYLYCWVLLNELPAKKSQPTQMGTKTSFLFFFLSFMNWISEGSVVNCIPTIVSYIDQLLRTRTLKEKRKYAKSIKYCKYITKKKNPGIWFIPFWGKATLCPLTCLAVVGLGALDQRSSSSSSSSSWFQGRWLICRPLGQVNWIAAHDRQQAWNRDSEKINLRWHGRASTRA